MPDSACEIAIFNKTFWEIIIGHYILRRLMLMVPTVLLVTIMTFALVRLMPGDVVMAQLAESPGYRPEDVAALRAKLGIDKPAYVQYPKWIQGILVGDLGTSLWSGRKITGLIREKISTTIELAGLAFLMANLIALTLGVVAAARPESGLDYALRILSIGGLSIPGFFLATLVIIVGSKYFGYVPPFGRESFFTDPIANLERFLIPAAVIAVSSSAAIMRMLRSSMLEVLRQDYIRTAWAKGLGERNVIYRHALKNAFLPVVTLQGLQLGHLLTGSVIVEIIFGLTGIGRLTFDAVQTRDYTVVQASTLVFGSLFILINLVVDLIYAYLDPRIAY